MRREGMREEERRCKREGKSDGEEERGGGET